MPHGSPHSECWGSQDTCVTQPDRQWSQYECDCTTCDDASCCPAHSGSTVIVHTKTGSKCLYSWWTGWRIAGFICGGIALFITACVCWCRRYNPAYNYSQNRPALPLATAVAVPYGQIVAD